MKELIEIGGAGFLIPAVFSVLVLYAARGLFGWYGHRSQHRKEFLELWEQARHQDDLWLEVAVRHWLGTYLPAHVIRLAMSQPDKSQSLIELSELWPLFRYDRDARSVGWLHKRHQTPAKFKSGRGVLLTGYFVCALLAVISGVTASRFGPQVLSGWAYGFLAVILGFLAFACLMREDTMKIGAMVGEEWLGRINRSASQAAGQSQVERGDIR